MRAGHGGCTQMVRSAKPGARYGRQREAKELQGRDLEKAGGRPFAPSWRNVWVPALLTLALVWALLLVLVHAGLLLRTSGPTQEPGGPRLAKEVATGSALEEAIAPWRGKVQSLEATVSDLRATLTLRNGVVEALTKQLAQMGAKPGPAAAVAALPPGSAGGGGGGGNSPPSSGIRNLAVAELQQRAAAAAGVQAPAVAECLFQDGIDYVGNGREEVVPHISPQACCDMCGQKNKERPGSCSVGVISSEFDTPPLACWLKSDVTRAIRKSGVKACWPPGHPAIPPDPDVANKAAIDSHQSLLKEYTSLVLGQKPTTEDLRKRRDGIRNAMRHAWGSYRSLAWGKDELLPISGRGIERKFKHAVTMVDALDTLWIMGMREEFNEARVWLKENLPSRIHALGGGTSVFETTIRSLGGLLAAYDLSREKDLLDLAVILGNRINQVVGADGVTPYMFNGGNGGMKCRSLAESGTIQLEMRYLTRVTGDPSFSAKVDKFYEEVRRHPSLDGLWPNCFQKHSGKITFGADGDSFYEYLLKVWLQGGQTDDSLWQMYDNAADGMEKHLIRKGPDGLTYLGESMWQGGQSEHHVEEMEHLTCFVPGWLALGAKTVKGVTKRDRRMTLAAELAETCWQMYAQQPTGIGPERVKHMRMDLSATDTREYILRPEATEGWWYMHELTEDPKYREYGWRSFMNFNKWLWVEHGYASLKDVRRTDKVYIDRMESFFMAETLKYMYLLQDPDNTVKLDKYVFNTEAHPLSILELAPKPPP